MREKGKGKERKEKGKKKGKERAGFPPTDDPSTDGIHRTKAPKGRFPLIRVHFIPSGRVGA